uniref:DNA-binding protein inhibitor ID-4 n=1 Tax=Malurus cyaneus samueli TaxID=2593467 RepID=A0A8C5TAP5_9PASS
MPTLLGRGWGHRGGRVQPSSSGRRRGRAVARAAPDRGDGAVSRRRRVPPDSRSPSSPDRLLPPPPPSPPPPPLLPRGSARAARPSSSAPPPGPAAIEPAALCLQCDMNDCYSRLRKLVPTIPPNKRVSKVEILQHVIDYILDLQLALETHPALLRQQPPPPALASGCGVQLRIPPSAWPSLGAAVVV